MYKKGIYKILTNEPLTDAVWRMTLAGDTQWISAPGQFVNIALEGKYLRRPISICDYDDCSIALIYKVVGGGTEQMSRMLPGETLDLLTGLGNGFSTKNLESLADWSPANKPTLAIVSEAVYSGFNTEVKAGLEAQVKVVVINVVEGFLDSSFNTVSDFNENLAILAKAFGNTERADELGTSIADIVSDIHSTVSGKTPRYSDAYVGGTSLSGSKELTWTVGNYITFNLANVNNAYSGTDTVARDAGSEVMSSTTPDVIFMDLSGTTQINNCSGSTSVLTYAQFESVPIFTLLPYFWFGYNFDNALADAYMVAYACYEDALTLPECISKIEAVYEAFYPGLSDGSTVLGAFDNYYETTGTGLTFDGERYYASVSDGTATFTATPFPGGSGGSGGCLGLIAAALMSGLAAVSIPVAMGIKGRY